ncbi:MAG: hypothetical protein HFJ34_06040 [Clostridia bacterium]|nr:hypothetical protein [Clostridia bacterium]
MLEFKLLVFNNIDEDIKNGINIIIPMTIEDSTNEFFKLDLAYEMLNEEDTRIEKMEVLYNDKTVVKIGKEFQNIIEKTKEQGKYTSYHKMESLYNELYDKSKKEIIRIGKLLKKNRLKVNNIDDAIKYINQFSKNQQKENEIGL